MFSPQVTLRSGGYLIINQTEALVSIDVNSGRSTREHNIEDTALQTNLEAAEEVARQLRLRDLAGLIVIDFIDMEEKRNNRAVERKLKEALKNDRARIQVGRISHFGLLEMSRQRIRTGVLESTTTICPVCQGTGHVRAPSSVALHVLRSLEDQLLKSATHNLTIRTRTEVALYILNQKRANLSELEQRFGVTIAVLADETLTNGSHFTVERGELVERREPVRTSVQPDSVQPVVEEEEDDDILDLEEDEEISSETEVEAEAEGPGQAERDDRDDQGGRKRRRRRRRRGGGEAHAPGNGSEAHAAGRPLPAGAESALPDEDEDAEGAEEETGAEAQHPSTQDAEGQRKRRRGRRGGRRGRRGGRDDRPQGEAHGGGDRPSREPVSAPEGASWSGNGAEHVVEHLDAGNGGTYEPSYEATAKPASERESPATIGVEPQQMPVRVEPEYSPRPKEAAPADVEGEARERTAEPRAPTRRAGRARGRCARKHGEPGARARARR